MFKTCLPLKSHPFSGYDHPAVLDNNCANKTENIMDQYYVQCTCVDPIRVQAPCMLNFSCQKLVSDRGIPW